MSATATAIEASGRRALIGYLPVGFPDLATSIEAAVEMASAGCTALELGVPYSDPGLDGPVIQAATQATLERGFALDEVFDAVAAIRERTDIPVLVMTYWNPVLRYGVDTFASRLATVGGSGLITPDLTPENASAWIDAAKTHDLDRVFLAAPSSSDARIDAAIEASRGFVYTVSTMGTTGERGDVDKAARRLSERIAARGEALQREGRLATSALRCVGIGISSAAQVRDVLTYADGAIVGTALVRALRDGGVSAVRALTAELASGAVSSVGADVADTIIDGPAETGARASRKGSDA